MKTTVKILALLLLLCLFSVESRADDCLPIKVRNPEGNYIIPGAMGDIVYRRVNGRELALDAYVQKRGDRRPAVIVIHGGGWSSGSRIAFIGQFLETLTRAGYNWFSIDYRLGGVKNYRDGVDDVQPLSSLFAATLASSGSIPTESRSLAKTPARISRRCSLQKNRRE